MQLAKFVKKKTENIDRMKIADDILNGTYKSDKQKKAEKIQQSYKKITSSPKEMAKAYATIKAAQAGTKAINTINSMDVKNATNKAEKVANTTKKFLTDFDYRNKVGEKALMGTGTALSQFSKGALKTVENWGDAARSATDDFNNWVAYKTGIIDKKEYERQKDITRKSIAADAVGDFWKNNLGWNEENAQTLKDYSYVTEDNLLGQLSYGLGQQAPALMIGNTQAVQNLMTNPALQSVAGDGAVKNIARGLIRNAPMNAEIGLRSYGGAVEEALQNGATMEQARRYGLLNAGTEIATEWMTGGVPGVENTTGLFDKGVDAVIDKTTGKLKKETSKAIAKSLLSYGFDALGEGLEESVSEIFSPLIKNMTYSNGEKIDWNSVLNAGIMGMLQGGILNAPSAVTNARSDIRTARQIDRANKEAARQQAEQQAREELNTAAQSRLNEVYQQNQENAPIFNQQNRMMELAQQQVQVIQQQVQSGQISPQEGTQQINDIQRYITAQQNAQMSPTANETQQSNVIGQEQQNVAQNANNEVARNENVVEQKQEKSNAEKTFKNIKTKEDMDKLISNLKDKVENIKTGEDLKNTFKEIYDIYKVYNKSNDIYEVVEKDGLYGTKFESEFYNPDVKYKPLNEEIKIQKDNLESWLNHMQNDTDKIVYDNQDKVTPTIGKKINSLDEVTPITTDDFQSKLKDYINKETEDIKGKFESDNGHLYRGGKEIKYLYRAIDQAEMDSIKKNGYIKSNQSKNIGYEIEQGLTDFKDGYPGFYLPRNADGYIIKIEAKPENGFFYDSDEYAKTPNQIPASQIVEINGEKINNLKTKHFNKDQYDEALEYRNSLVDNQGTSDSSFSNEKNNIAEAKTEPVIKFDNETKKQTAKQITDVLNKNLENNENADIFDTIEKDTGKKLRGFVKTVTNATGETELVNAMDGKKITYERESNKKNMSIAENRAKGMEYKDVKQSALDLIHSDKRLNASDQAFIQLAIEQSLQNKDADGYVQLTTDAAIYRTEYARVLQIAGIMKKADPVTQLDALRKIINREKLKNNKAYRDVEINNDLVQKVLDTRNDDGTWNQEKFNEAMDELTTDIAQQTKGTWQEKVNEWRYLAMLGNPKTHFRNILANIAMNGVQSVKDKLAGGLEDITIGTYNKATGKEIQRQRTIKPASSEQKAIANQAVEEYYSKNKERNKYYEGLTSSGLLADIENKRTPFKNEGLGKIVNKVSEWNSSALDKEDVKFSKSYSKKAMANYMAANNITQADIDANPELVQDALEFGLEQGREATFHQKSQTADSLRKLRQDLRKGSIRSKTLGVLLDSQIPFINTPMNILKTGIDYSPLGFAVTVSDTVNAKPDAKATTFINGLSKQLTGNGLMAVGLLLAKMGYLTSGDSDDDKKSQLESYLGKTDYSLILGNQAYDISWLSPSAMPILVGAEIYKASKREKVDANLLVDILTSTMDPITEMSFMESIQRSIQTFQSGSKALGEVGMNAVSSYLNQFLPTLMSQVATATDTKKRSSSGKTQVEKLINSLKYKTPGLRQTLEPTTDTWGNEKELASNPIQRAFEAFVSPANRSEIKVDKTTKELERIYDNTGSGLPTVKGKTQSVDAQSYVLSGKDYTEFKKTYGKTAKNYLDKLMEQPKYKSADDSEREDMISAVYKYSTYKAKQEYAKKHNIPFEYKQSDGTGYNYPKYYMTIGDEDFLKYIAEKYNK